jgi:DNA-binding HxlR family transcriptional regulator
LQRRPLRFSELSAGLPGIRDKILSARLKQLASMGLLVRRVHPGPPLRTEYELTRNGRAFGKLAAAIQRWGNELVRGEA